MTIHVVGHFAKARSYQVQYRTKKNRRNPDLGWQHLTSYRYTNAAGKKSAGVKAMLHKIAFADLNSEYQVRVVNVSVKVEHQHKCEGIKIADYLKPFKRAFVYHR